MERDAKRFAEGEPQPVGVDATTIETDLRALWDDAAESGVIARFVGLNLVVLLDREDLVPETTAVLAELARSHPARVIVVVVEGGSERPLAAWVSAHCHLGESDTRHICSEQITITAGRPASRDVPALADQLLLPDLPVVLWARAPVHPACVLLEALARRARQVVVDSCAAGRPAEELAALARFARSHGARCVLGDLAWLGGSPWREVSAQLFDPPAARPLLQTLESVDLRVLREPISIPAIYHAAWLASRLGWEPASSRAGEGALNLAFSVAGRPVRLRVEAAEEGPPRSAPGDLLAVAFHGRLEGASRTLRAEAAPDGGSIGLSVHPPAAALPPRGIERETPPLADRLHREVEFPRRDALFEEVLPVAAAVAGTIGGADEGA